MLFLVQISMQMHMPRPLLSSVAAILIRICSDSATMFSMAIDDMRRTHSARFEHGFPLPFAAAQHALVKARGFVSSGADIGRWNDAGQQAWIVGEFDRLLHAYAQCTLQQLPEWWQNREADSSSPVQVISCREAGTWQPGLRVNQLTAPGSNIKN
jgi:hypothetical protein